MYLLDSFVRLLKIEKTVSTDRNCSTKSSEVKVQKYKSSSSTPSFFSLVSSLHSLRNSGDKALCGPPVDRRTTGTAGWGGQRAQSEPGRAEAGSPKGGGRAWGPQQKPGREGHSCMGAGPRGRLPGQGRAPALVRGMAFRGGAKRG